MGKDLPNTVTSSRLKPSTWGMATKKDLEGMATKEDLEGMATKEDLSRFGDELRQEMQAGFHRLEEGQRLILEVVKGVPEAPKAAHIGEFKTANDKHFAMLKKDGVEKAKPLHYAQVQVYMGLMGINRALYMARNKNTDHLYSERVKFDKAKFDALMGKARRIVKAAQPPERAANRPDAFLCKFCPAYKLCWGAIQEGEPLVPIRATSRASRATTSPR